jgi:transcriptional regulator with XRE-family HTH domain
MDRKALFGKRIRELRKMRRLSQEALAERSGISTQYVSNIERGTEHPTLDLLFSLSDALKVDLAEMCDYENVETMDRKALQAKLNKVVRAAEPDHLKTALKLLKAVLR